MQLGGLRSAALSAVLLAAASGCGSSSSGTGKLNVHLMDAPGDYLEVNVDVQEVQIHGDAGWQTIASPNEVINLLTLTNGVSKTLAQDYPIEAGHYTQMRLILGDRNSVVPVGATQPEPLEVPSGMQSGIKLNVNFDVEAGTTKDVFIDFDAHRSVFVHQAGQSGKYILRPVVFAYAEVVTGSISGIVTDAATGQPVVGAAVTAQVPAGDAPVVVRGTVTDATGKYVLSHLPVDASYHVVSQPVVDGKVYEAHASPAIALTTAAPLPVHDFAVAEAAAHGGISGKVTPTADENTADLVTALQTFDLGGTQVKLAVRSAAGAVSGADETWAMADLPAGVYGLFVTRRVFDPVTQTESSASGAPVSVTVTDGATATQDLVAPAVP